VFRKLDTIPLAVNQPEMIAHASDSPMITQGPGGAVGPMLAKRTSLPSICSRLVPEVRPPMYFVSRKVDFGIARLFLNGTAHAANRCSRGPMVAETTVSRRPRPAGARRPRRRRATRDHRLRGGRRASPGPERGPIRGTSAFPKLSRRVEYS